MHRTPVDRTCKIWTCPQPDHAVPIMLLDKRGTTVRPLAVGRVDAASPTVGGVGAVQVERIFARKGSMASAAMARLTASLHPRSPATVRGNHATAVTTAWASYARTSASRYRTALPSFRNGTGDLPSDRAFAMPPTVTPQRSARSASVRWISGAFVFKTDSLHEGWHPFAGMKKAA